MKVVRGEGRKLKPRPRGRAANESFERPPDGWMPGHWLDVVRDQAANTVFGAFGCIGPDLPVDVVVAEKWWAKNAAEWLDAIERLVSYGLLEVRTPTPGLFGLEGFRGWAFTAKGIEWSATAYGGALESGFIDSLPPWLEPHWQRLLDDEGRP